MKSIKEKTREAAKKHSISRIKYPPNGVNKDCMNDFIAGAEWERERDKWISVEDEMPLASNGFDKLSRIVMTCDNYRTIGIGHYNFISKTWLSGSCTVTVTHWQSLLEPPKQKENNHD